MAGGAEGEVTGPQVGGHAGPQVGQVAAPRTVMSLRRKPFAGSSSSVDMAPTRPSRNQVLPKTPSLIKYIPLLRHLCDHVQYFKLHTDPQIQALKLPKLGCSAWARPRALTYRGRCGVWSTR